MRLTITGVGITLILAGLLPRVISLAEELESQGAEDFGIEPLAVERFAVIAVLLSAVPFLLYFAFTRTELGSIVIGAFLLATTAIYVLYSLISHSEGRAFWYLVYVAAAFLITAGGLLVEFLVWAFVDSRKRQESMMTREAVE